MKLSPRGATNELPLASGWRRHSRGEPVWFAKNACAYSAHPFNATPLTVTRKAFHACLRLSGERFIAHEIRNVRFFFLSLCKKERTRRPFPAGLLSRWVSVIHLSIRLPELDGIKIFLTISLANVSRSFRIQDSPSNFYIIRGASDGGLLNFGSVPVHRTDYPHGLNYRELEM